MKPLIKIAIPFILLLFIFSSCLITSLHPLYTKDDLVFNKNLLGTWIDNDSSTWILEPYYKSEIDIFGSPTKKDSSLTKNTETYKLTLISEKGKGELLLHLAKLNNHIFIDFFPFIDTEKYLDNYFTGMHFLPVHSFGIVNITDTLVKINLLSAEWLVDKVDAKEVNLSIQELDENGEIIISSTPEIQEFLINYADNKKAFDFEIILKR